MQLTNSKNHTSSTCLHIGCGLKTPEQWENIDASPSLLLSKIPIFSLSSLYKGPKWSNKIQYGDIMKGLKYQKNSCDLIFAAHILEHLSLPDFHVALKNIYSYLKPGGIFRFIVPDLKQYVDTYIKAYLDTDSPEVAASAAHQFLESSWLGCLKSRKSLLLRFQESLSNSRHQWMWDAPSLLNTIPKYGFSSVRRCQYGDWYDSRFNLVEEEVKYVNAIGIEAIK